MAENWIKFADRKPPYGKLVYTRDDKGNISVYTRYHNRHVGDVYSSRISAGNNAEVEWLEEDADQPCPDERCNSRLGAAPIPQCVTAVFWAEEADAFQKVADAARAFVHESENWEAYQDSKESNSVAWPPEFLLLAQAVEAKYGPMPVDDDEVAPAPES